MTPPRAHVSVATLDLRAALLAVRAHASQDDDLPVLTRLRLTFSPDGNLYVTATDRYTMGLSLVSIWDDRLKYGEVVEVDLGQQDVKDILEIFKPEKDAGDQKVSILVTAGDVTLTDDSGLFPDSSKQLRLPVLAPSKYPDIHRLLAAAVKNANTLARTAHLDGYVSGALAQSVWAAGRTYKRFVAAADAYGEAIQLRRTAEARAALLVSVGESFIGLLMPITPDEDALAVADGYLRGWARRLPEPLDKPVAMPEPVDVDDAVDLNPDDAGDGQAAIDDPPSD